MSYRILRGDCRQHMRDDIPAGSVHTVVSSPPYWGGIRDYRIPSLTWGGSADCDHEWTADPQLKHPGKRNNADVQGKHQYAFPQTVPSSGMTCRKCGAWHGDFGNEPTVEQYIAHTLEIFEGLRRVLRDDGVIWWNLGDTFATGAGKANVPGGGKQGQNWSGYAQQASRLPQSVSNGNKMLVPHRVAIALQEAGWIVRQDVVWCLSGGAWVYAKTQKGEMPVMLKDLVRLDPLTVRLWNGLKWTRVLSWTKSNDDSEKLELVLRSGERIGCTGRHLWPTQRGNVPARNLRIGDIVEKCQLPEPAGATSPACLNDDTLWFLGLYLAEGSRHYREGDADRLSLALSSDEAHLLSRIEAVARRLGGSISHAIRGGSMVVRISGRILVAIVEQYIGGRTAIDKRFNVSVWSLPNTALRQIAFGYLTGDGHRDDKNRRWRIGFCRNYALERDIRTLAARLGAQVTITPCVVQYQDGQRPAFRGEWRWEASSHINAKDRGEIVSIRRSRARQYWDVEVEDEPHTFSLSSGVLTHNCKPSPMPESINGVRWERCRVKVQESKRAAKGSRHAESHSRPHGDREGADFASSAQWQECPGCRKCETNNGYVLRRGSWRPTNGHEYILMITKGTNYFADAVAAAEAATGNAHPRGRGVNPKSEHGTAGQERQNSGFSRAVRGVTETRNPRSVWTDEITHLLIRAANGEDISAEAKELLPESVWTFANEPYAGAHFAAYPTRLVHKCLTASVSQAGYCPACGSPYAPVVERQRVPTRPGTDSKVNGVDGAVTGNRDARRHIQITRANSYWPTCDCNAGAPVPARVYDPFGGSGTTLQVAHHMGLDAICSELGEQYIPLIQERNAAVPRCLMGPSQKKTKRKRKRGQRERLLFAE